MISKEPRIRVGIIENATELRGIFNAPFAAGGSHHRGEFTFRAEGGRAALYTDGCAPLYFDGTIVCENLKASTFTLKDVTIGIHFHWQRSEDQSFQGDLHVVLRDNGTLTVINSVDLEEYLASVISSEMSAEAPLELLKAHAVTSRSWLAAMLEREQKNIAVPSQRTIKKDDELVRWYDREDHDIYDVCADDHCQRYQGVTKIISPNVVAAVNETRGYFLVYDNAICDARFSKACGGRTEEFQNAWEERTIAYLASVSDSGTEHPALTNEEEAQSWILGNPDCYCNTSDGTILRQVLPSFDRETTDFFRWSVEYTREELEELIRIKSGEDIGMLKNLLPLRRGPSGRICRLRIEGTKKTVIVGKELEIRRWLSKSHLYSSAFVVERQPAQDEIPARFVLRGAGWGHGVGLCQIGAAVMAAKGFPAGQIVRHYFKGAELKKLY